jgi:hypothetical protein
MRVGKVAVAAATTLGLLMGTATAASAEVRHVSPTGTGAFPCAADDPCSLLVGLTSGALSGDEVRLAAGDYTLPATSPALPLEIAGADGARPTITLTGPLSLTGGTLRHVAITSSSAALSVGNATLEDAVVTSAAPTAVSVTTGLIRNTVIRATAPGATALDAMPVPVVGLPAKLRNVTVLASGTAVHAAGFGMQMPAVPPDIPGLCTMSMPAQVDLVNVIARGGDHDLVSTDSVCGAIGKITATTSNFDPAHSILSASSQVADRGNQAAAPLFVDQAAGDVREAAGSPTIDTGSVPALASEIGTLDLAGVSRILGGLPDIGAFEFVVPITLPGGGGGDGGGSPGGGNPGGGPTPGGKPFSVKLLKPLGLRLAALQRRGWRLHASCSAACKLALKVTPGRGKQRVLARAAGSRKSAGTLMLRVKITKAGRRALRQKRASWLRFTLVGRDAKGVRRTAKRVLKVRR